MRAAFVAGEGCSDDRSTSTQRRCIPGGWCTCGRGCEGGARTSWLLASQFRSCVWSQTGELSPDHREGGQQHSVWLSRSGQSPSKEQTNEISRPWARSGRLARSQPKSQTSPLQPCERVRSSPYPKLPGSLLSGEHGPSQSGSRSRAPSFWLKAPK